MPALLPDLGQRSHSPYFQYCAGHSPDIPTNPEAAGCCRQHHLPEQKISSDRNASNIPRSAQSVLRAGHRNIRWSWNLYIRRKKKSHCRFLPRPAHNCTPHHPAAAQGRPAVDRADCTHRATRHNFCGRCRKNPSCYLNCSECRHASRYLPNLHKVYRLPM